MFEEWMRELVDHFRKNDRKICLIVDNCPAHCDVAGMTNVRLEYLDPNTTSKAQPMDQGVIKSLKSKYRRKIVREFIRSLDAGYGIPKISIVSAMRMLVSAWKDVSSETIQNCFRKCSISVEDQEFSISDQDDPFQLIGLQEDIDKLRQLNTAVIPEDFSVEDVVGFDDEVSVTKDHSTDAEILSWAKGEEDDVEKDEDDDEDDDVVETDVEIPCPNTEELYSAINTIRRYSFFTSSQALITITEDLEKIVHDNRKKNLKQKCITDFF